VGSILLGGFVLWESRAQFPLMPLAMWRDRTFATVRRPYMHVLMGSGTTDRDHSMQVITVQCLGEMGLSSTEFWLCLLLQNVRRDSPIKIALELLPMVIGGVSVNVVCALILHRVSNQVLMGVGSVAYTIAFLLLSFLPENAPYWAFIFPSLILMVIGFDIQYNITNVSLHLSALSYSRSTLLRPF
jgi:hypothetical protein